MPFRNRRGQYLIRALSTVLAVALALFLSPCCEVFAASLAAGVPDTADTHHAHHDNGDPHHDEGNAPLSDEHCAPWLGQTFIPAGESALLSSGSFAIDAPLLYGLPSVQFPRLANVDPHAGSPPPARAIYLLTSRFLL